MTGNLPDSAPNTEHDDREPVEALAEEFVERHRRGEQPTIEEYAQNYPELADEIRDLFPTIAAMERLKIDQTVPAVASSLPLDRLGDFQLVREIGRGGMGVVYEAMQESLGRRVALKILANQLLPDAKHLKRFEREAQTAARLHHTNIVPVFGIGEQNGQHYYVMQLIDGVGLNTVIDVLRASRPGENGLPRGGFEESAVSAAQALCRGSMRFPKPKDTATMIAVTTDLKSDQIVAKAKSAVKTEIATEQLPDVTGSQNAPTAELAREQASPLSQRYWRSVARIGVQLADALHYAHQQGTLHRDIKPANLLLDREGIVWITDFGLAKAMEDAGVTRTGDVVGTPQYMAPEQFEGKQNELTDQYSLGLTLYEMLALEPAYFDTQRAALIQKIMQSRPTPLRSVQPNLPRDLETIVMKAMAKETADRYATAGELRDDLQRFLDDRPIRARKATVAERLWRWCRRNRAVASLLGTAFFLAILVAVVASVGYVRTNRALQREAEQRQRAEDTLNLGLEALDKVFKQLAPERVVAASELTIEWKEGEEVNVPIQPVLSPETAALLEELLVFYDKLAEKGNNNEKLRLQAAKANRRVGDIRLRFGDSEQAAAAYENALVMYEDILQDSPNLLMRTDLAGVHIALGLAYEKSRNHIKADRSYHDAIQLLQGEMASGNDGQEVRYELAKAYYQLGRKGPIGNGQPRKKGMKFGGGPNKKTVQPEEASLNKAISLLQKLVEEQPNAPGFRYQLALCYRALAGHQWIHYRKRDNEPLSKAIDILKKLVEDFRDVPDYQFALSETYAFGDVGIFRFSKFRFQADLERLRKAMELAETLATQHPNVPDYIASKAQIHYKLGRIQPKEERKEAERHLEQAVQLQERLTEQFPGVFHYQAANVRYVASLVDSWNRQKKHQQSKAKLEQLTSSLETRLKKEPANKMLHYPLFRYYSMLAKTLGGMRQFQAAKIAGQQAQKHIRFGPRRSFNGRGRKGDSRGKAENKE